MTANPLSVAKWWWIFLLACACAAGPSDMPNQYDRWSVAVLDYENLSPLNSSPADLTELLTARAIETIEDKGRYDVVERQQLAMLLEELNLGSSMVVDRKTQLKLGEITGARLMVFGNYQVIENQLRLDVRLVDVESGRVINAVSHVADEHNLPGWLDASAKSIATLFKR